MKEIIGKRFDEVFDLQMGKTPDRKNTLYFEGDNVWVSIRDMSNKDICESQEHISDDAIVNCAIKKVKAGTVIMSFKLTVGKCAIAAVDLYTNEAIMAFNLKDGYYIDSSFLYYYLQSYKWQGANKAVMGLTLNKATISKQIISIPPLPIQQKIVAELDTVCLIIDKKRQQLKELDKLAQAIFYDMFGDPVENEKGWEVKTMGQLCEIFAGGDKPSDLSDIQTQEYQYPVIANGDGIKGILGYCKNCRVKDDAITIGARGASIGNCRIVKNGFTPAIRLITLVPNNSLNCQYLYYFAKRINYKMALVQ